MMLKSATIQNFGPLPNAELYFAPGLNVVIGENGCGKSQLLKLLYSLLKVQADVKEPTKTELEKGCADKLLGVFRPEALGRLVKRRRGHDKCQIALIMKSIDQNMSVSFATRATKTVQVDQTPAARLKKSIQFHY